MRYWIAVGVLGGLVASGGAAAQIPVQVTAKAEDAVGARVVYQLRDAVARSAIVRVAAATDDRIEIQFMSMERPDDRPGTTTMYAVAYLWRESGTLVGSLMALQVGYCGANRAQHCAEAILARSLSESEDFLRVTRGRR